MEDRFAYSDVFYVDAVEWTTGALETEPCTHLKIVLSPEIARVRLDALVLLPSPLLLVLKYSTACLPFSLVELCHSAAQDDRGVLNS